MKDMLFSGKCCSAAALAAMALAAEASWNPGEPVVTYWYGPGCCRQGRDYIPLDDFWAKQLKEGGFNTVWATRPAERLDPVTRTWTPVGDEFDIALQRGGGALLRLQP